MKLKTTKKEIRENARKLYAVGYCDAESLLKGVEPFAYSVRLEGWACDYYDIGGGVIISTGYAPIGERIPYEITKAAEAAAQKINYDHMKSYENRCAEIAKIRAEWIAEAGRAQQ
jgi:hypothetical protein